MAKEFVWTDELVKEYLRLVTAVDGSDYWQQEINNFKHSKQKKDWEIVAYQHSSFKESIRYKRDDSLFYFEPTALNQTPIREEMLNSWNIYSVRRKSDGELFSVGDKVKLIRAKEIGEITKFSKSEISDKLFVYINLGGGEGYNNEIKYVEKVKQPLFTTKDGVDIYEGDECWCVENGRYSYRWSDIVNDGTIGECEYFSTEEAAEDYIFILHNKPCLSYKDVMDALNAYFKQPGVASQTLRQIVQQKLK